MSDPSPSRGLTMLDGVALVTGAAVASVHFREFAEELGRLGMLGAAGVCLAFAWLALTSAGPFVFLVRRSGRRPPGYPGSGDVGWLAIGLPWLVAALVVSARGESFDPTDRRYADALSIALMIASAVGLAGVVRSWPATVSAGAGTWTNAVGRALAATWPFQFGLWFLLMR